MEDGGGWGMEKDGGWRMELERERGGDEGAVEFHRFRRLHILLPFSLDYVVGIGIGVSVCAEPVQPALAGHVFLSLAGGGGVDVGGDPGGARGFFVVCPDRRLAGLPRDQAPGASQLGPFPSAPSTIS